MEPMVFLNLLIFIVFAANEDAALAKVSCPRDFPCDCKDVTSAGHVKRVIDCSNRSLDSLPYFGTLTGQSFDEILLNDNHIARLLSGSFRGLTVRKMDLSNNQITSFSDNAFSDVPGLEELSLVNCGLSSTSRSLEKLSRMRKLDLHNNKIKQLHPKSFISMVDLEYLDLHNNPVDFGTSFEAFKNLHKVKELYLQHCGLRVIPKEVLRPMNKLVNLNLGHNRISSLPYGLLSSLKNLVFLDLSENPLSIDPKPDLFQSIKKVETLKLSGCFVKGNKIDKTLFIHVRQIRKLVFANCNLTSIAPGTFSGLNHIHYLDIGGNKVSLSESLFQGITDTVHTLKLNNMDLPIFPYNLLKVFDNLKRVYVENNKISKLPEMIFSGFKHTDSSVHLSGNRLRHVSNRILRGALRPISIYMENTGLKKLDFITENPCSFWEATLDVSQNEIICDCDVYRAMQMKVGRVIGTCIVPETFAGLKLNWQSDLQPEEAFLTREGNITELCAEVDRSKQKYDCGCKTWIELDAPEMCPYIDVSTRVSFSPMLVALVVLWKVVL